MPPKAKEATAEAAATATPVDAWVQTAKEALEKKRLNSVCGAFQELRKLLVQEPQLAKSFQDSREVGDLLSEASKYLVMCGLKPSTNLAVLRDACVAVGNCAAQLKHGEGIEKIADATGRIGSHYKGKDNLCGTEEMRDMLVAMGIAAVELKHEDTIKSTAKAIGNLACGNASNKTLFGTTEVRDALLVMAKAVDWNGRWSISGVLHPIGNILCDNDANQKLFATEEMRDMLVEMGKMAVELWDEEYQKSIDSTIRLFSWITSNLSNQKLFGTKEVRDVLVALANEVVDLHEVRFTCTNARAIRNITLDNDANKKLFGTKEVRDALVAMGAVAVDDGDPTAVIPIAGAIKSITTNNANNLKLYGTEEVCDTLVEMGKSVDRWPYEEPRNDAMKAVTEAIRALRSYRDNAKIFDTREVKDALVEMSKAQAEEKRDSGAAKKRQR